MEIKIFDRDKLIQYEFKHPYYDYPCYIKIYVFPDYVKIDIIYEYIKVMLLNIYDPYMYNFQNNEIWKNISYRHPSLGICEKELLAAIETLRGSTV
jgi:hypothetical protein